MKTTKKVSIFFAAMAIISALFIFSNVMADITSGLSAYWPLNNNGQDVSGNYNLATLYGPTGADNRHNFTNFALDFDGVNDYADVADNDSLDIEASDFSISCWVRPDIAGYNLLDKRDQSRGGEGYLLYTDSATGRFSFKICGRYLQNGQEYTGTITYSSNSTIQQGVYSHLVISVDRDNASGMKFYLNNVLVATLNPTANTLPIYSSANLKIGKHNYIDSYYFNGRLDDLRIYKRAISASDVEELFNETNPSPIEYADETAIDFNNDGADEVIKLAKTTDGVVVSVVYLNNNTPTTITGFFSANLQMIPKTISSAIVNNNKVIVVTAENQSTDISSTQTYTIGSASPFGTPIILPLYQ